MFKHKHDWRPVDVVFGRWETSLRHRAFIATAACYHFWVCSCGRFAISGLPDRARLEGELPTRVAALSDFQIAKYLLRFIPKRDRSGLFPAPKTLKAN